MIRLATKDDLKRISYVHSICFKDSYSSQLIKHQSVMGGGNLLSSFYEEYLHDAPELFHVACDEEGQIIGYCMGYYMDNDSQMERFVHNNILRLSWKTAILLLTVNRPAWQKILSRLKHKPVVTDWEIVNTKYESIKNNKRGDLLSVCVLPEYRGMGYAQKLMESFLTAMTMSGRKVCLLSVKANNLAARKYYERNGFEVYRTRGSEGITYIKPLTSDGTDNVSD